MPEVLFVINGIASLRAAQTTAELMAAVHALGHRAWVASMDDLGLAPSGVGVVAKPGDPRLPRPGSASKPREIGALRDQRRRGVVTAHPPDERISRPDLPGQERCQSRPPCAARA